jgi:hypothetical protein
MIFMVMMPLLFMGMIMMGRVMSEVVPMIVITMEMAFP